MLLLHVSLVEPVNFEVLPLSLSKGRKMGKVEINI